METGILSFRSFVSKWKTKEVERNLIYTTSADDIFKNVEADDTALNYEQTCSDLVVCSFSNEMFEVYKEKLLKGTMEKWLLVLVIVGGTALVFLVCFPIDFYLYRKRKRQARERNKFPNFEPKPVARAGQCHASVTMKPSMSSVWTEDIKRKQVASKGGFARIVGLIRKKQQEEKQQTHDTYKPEIPSSSSREYSSNFPMRSDTPSTQETLVQPERKTEWPKLNTRSLVTTHVVTAQDIHNQPWAYSNDISPKTDELVSNTEDDALLSVQPRRKLSNVSAAWSENEELVERDYRHLDYGALKSLENLNNPLQNETDPQSTCYTISTGRQTSFPTHESCTDTDETHGHLASGQRYLPKSPTTVDFVQTERGFGRVKYSKMHAKFTSDSNLLQQNTHRHTSTTSNESSEEYNITQPILKSSRSVNFPSGGFGRSFSDQSVCRPRESKSRHKTKKKNSVTPTNKSMSSVMLSGSTDEFNAEQVARAANLENGCDVGLRHLEKSKEPGKVKRSKKKRKKTFLKRQSSDSLPDLSAV